MVTKGVVLWFRRFHDRLMGFLVTFVVTVAGYMLVLSFCRMLWRLYSETKVGDLFAAGNKEIFSVIDAVLGRNPFLLSLEMSFLAIKVCFVIALICHFSFLKRIIYNSREISGKIMYTGVPCAAVTAWYFDASNLLFSFVICLIPVMVLFSYCFEMVSKFLPEPDDLIKNVIEKAGD